MSFYLEPPSGTISLQNLERFGEKRLNFLIKIYEAKNDRVRLFDVVHDAGNVVDSECLIDGTKKDAISHFFLRLALCKDIDTTDFLVTAETSLFEFRFLCMNEDELRELFRRTENMISWQTKSWKKVVRLYLKGDDSHCFYVPFSNVLNLVAKRHVVLTNGIAAVPFPKLREVVTDIFREVLKEGLKIAQEKRLLDQVDFRLRKLMAKLVNKLRERYRPFSEKSPLHTSLSHDTVPRDTKQFPPCMYNLQRVLQNRHRLKHHSRIQLTLFLKEIGMPIHEALMYWRKEYSTDVDNQDGCHHNWKDNEKRYVYNIRHLYGLEGSHINYRAHCCSSLQNFTPFTGEVGGCPLKHFDREHLNWFTKISFQKVVDSQNKEILIDSSIDGQDSSFCQSNLCNGCRHGCGQTQHVLSEQTAYSSMPELHKEHEFGNSNGDRTSISDVTKSKENQNSLMCSGNDRQTSCNNAKFDSVLKNEITLDLHQSRNITSNDYDDKNCSFKVMSSYEEGKRFIMSDCDDLNTESTVVLHKPSDFYFCLRKFSVDC
ncbi:PRI2 [Mytilus coruscus]|uniref:PRI2 n=1 Tax=Mytilus coruscus TaxID=42192 RepID=A0A6J8BXP5_MYTCO|nr:PRI2 [Mytilus coruscus]